MQSKVNPSGLCLCGCGNATWVSTTTDARGYVKGMPVGYYRGHSPSRLLGERAHNWVGDKASKNAAHNRARIRYSLDGVMCEVCGLKPACDRHHKDGNYINNAASNIAKLCRKCHMEADGRLERLKDKQKELVPFQFKPPQPCIVCKQLRKPLRRGRCHACNEYFRRRGVERSAERARSWKEK